MMKTWMLALVALAATPAVAQTDTPNILDKAVNVPGTNWQVYGSGQTVATVKDAGVPGGEVRRVTVPVKGAKAWDVGANSPIQKPIAQGDTILVAAWLRAPQLKDGETTAIPFLGANDNAAPYTPIAQGNVAITNKWTLYYASGKAPRAFAANTARATVHLAADRHVVDLGPIFVLDFGANYDPAKLPKN